MELRNYFSLFCLHQETQLIFIYLPITSHILGAFVNSQVQGHREVRLLEIFYSAFSTQSGSERVRSFLNWLSMKGLILMDGLLQWSPSRIWADSHEQMNLPYAFSYLFIFPFIVKSNTEHSLYLFGSEFTQLPIWQHFDFVDLKVILFTSLLKMITCKPLSNVSFFHGNIGKGSFSFCFRWERCGTNSSQNSDVSLVATMDWDPPSDT